MSESELLWLTRYGSEGASSRYRAYQYRDLLASAGFNSTYEPLTTWRSTLPTLAKGVFARIRTVRGFARQAPSGPTVIFQKEPVMPPMVARMLEPGLRSLAGRFIWDLDDAVWIGRRGAEAMALRMRERAGLVVAGNELIADWASHSQADVHVIPTCFCPAWPVEAPEVRHEGPVRVAWIGSPVTARLVEPYGEVLASALEKLPELTLQFVGGVPPACLRGHPRVSQFAWSVANEHQILQNADFGLAVQPRSPSADRKCGFKVVQYLAYGLTPIVSDNPVHRSLTSGLGLILDGSRDADSLIERVAVLPTASERATSKDRWRKRYSTEVGSELWIRALSSLS